MNQQPRVMLLIDADNVSADVIEQAIDLVRSTHGAIHVRRAYCTPEAAITNQKLFKTCSIRPIVNLSTGKNSNDIALAVDAMDLAISERPDVAVIVSSDSDFAPLVIRLREKGCRVEGIGQLGKTGDDSKPVYDAFTDLPHRKGGPSAKAAAAKSPAKRSPATRSRRAPAPVVSPPPAAPPPPQSPPLPQDVQRILAELHELRAGEQLELRIAAERLRAVNLLTRSGSSTKLFKKYPEMFALTPARQPNKVQYTGPVPG